MTHAEAAEQRPRLLVDRRGRRAPAPTPTRRERLVARLGYRVYEPPRGPEVEFLPSAPELAGAIRSGHARFTHVALAGWLGCTGSHPYERDTVRAQYGSLLEDFEREAGAMCRWYFGRTKLVAAVLTDDDMLSVVIGRDVDTSRPELVDLVRCCQRIGYQAWHRLAPYDRRLCQNMVFSVVEEAFRMLDDDDDENEHAGCVNALAERLKEAEQFMLRCAARRAQSHYLKGVLLGGAAIAVILGLLTAVVQATHEMSPFRSTLLLVAVAGAAGAAISVPMRMTSGSFRMNLPTLNAEMKGTDLHLVGALRPIMGLVLALASYTVVLAGLVPMKEGDGELKQTALYVTIGFLAGFTERFAQDMFVRSGNGLQGVMGDSPSTGPSAGLAPPPGAQPEAARG